MKIEDLKEMFSDFFKDGEPNLSKEMVIEYDSVDPDEDLSDVLEIMTEMLKMKDEVYLKLSWEE